MVLLQSQTCFCTFIPSFLIFIINYNFLFFRANNGNQQRQIQLQNHDIIGALANVGFNNHEEDVP